MTGCEFPIVPSPHTKLTCSSCGIDEAPMFYLKRKRGLFALLCFRNGQGCYERSRRDMCEYIDHSNHGMQCDQLAEYQLIYGDNTASAHCCRWHVHTFLKDHEQVRVFPLEAD